MATRKSSDAGFPTRLKHSTERSDVVYTLTRDMYAIRGGVTQRRHEAAVLTLNADGGDAIQVFRGAPPQARATADGSAVAPVYSPPASSSVVVPTGRVFVRFAVQVKVESKAPELKKAGYKIVKTLAYAPNAAWVENVNGDAAAGLNNIAKLEKLPGVENVEPQLLAQRTAR